MTGWSGGAAARRARAAGLAAGLAVALSLGGAARGERTPGEAQAPAAAAADPGPEPASAGAEPPAEARGSVTGLSLPRFVSIRASEARARRGPSLHHRVDWLYRRRGLPVRVTAEHGNWRRVEDIEGLGGWVHHSLISGARTAIVTEPMATLRRRPSTDAPEVARLEAGVIARLGECEGGWCRLEAGGHRGWAPEAAVWGADEATRN